MTDERLPFLDGLRGITLISMIAYHGMFDLVELYGVPVDWFWKLPGYVWQQSICWTFILLSGFCWQLGKHPVKRGLVISACGLVITAVTFVFLPSERILFGILTFTGAAMLVLACLHPILRKMSAWAGLACSICLFALTRNVNDGYWGFEGLIPGAVPRRYYQGMFMTFLGFPEPGFFSGDYFSVIPWIFLYCCGYFLYGILQRSKAAKKILRIRTGFLEWIGKHSLVIYMLHQPFLLLVLECIF